MIWVFVIIIILSLVRIHVILTAWRAQSLKPYPTTLYVPRNCGVCPQKLWPRIWVSLLHIFAWLVLVLLLSSYLVAYSQDIPQIFPMNSWETGKFLQFRQEPFLKRVRSSFQSHQLFPGNGLSATRFWIQEMSSQFNVTKTTTPPHY